MTSESLPQKNISYHIAVEKYALAQVQKKGLPRILKS